jgi:hypothetical protein
MLLSQRDSTITAAAMTPETGCFTPARSSAEGMAGDGSTGCLEDHHTIATASDAALELAR